MDSRYDDEPLVYREVCAGNHRDLVGGLWTEIGELQLDFMQAAGLQPADFLLDVGCGCLRGGVAFVDYLLPGHYYGIDISLSLLAAGRAEIRRAGLSEKLPAENLHCTSTFDASSFGRTFDFAIAQSLFTHLSWKSVRRCLEMVHPFVNAGGRFCATYFRLPDDSPPGLAQQHEPGGVVTYDSKDPYHYRRGEIEQAIQGLPWTLVNDVTWNHPRAQRMLVFLKS